MESYANFAEFMPDPKNSLLSLQFLDDVAQTSEQPTHHPIERISYQYDNQFSRVANYNQPTYPAYSQVQVFSQKNDRTQYNDPELVMSNIQPRNLFDHQYENVNQTVLKREPSHEERSQVQILKNLAQSNISGQTSRNETNTDHNPQTELALLKQLQQKAMATFDKTQYAESVKQNFEVLFQKVYGIIEEIQQRNQKSQSSKSNLKLNSRRELSFNPRVVELSMGKQNYGTKRKKYCNIQTELDCSNDQDDYSKNYMKTQQCVPVRTPCSSASKMMISTTNNTLSLSKQLPYVVTSRSQLNTARSDKSGKAKGITLVSAQKKFEAQEKKPVKITLMQKKIVLQGKKNIQSRVHTKTNKKTSAFNPNNFFNSRRVSARII